MLVCLLAMSILPMGIPLSELPPMLPCGQYAFALSFCELRRKSGNRGFQGMEKRLR